jgi:hypothetical protein
MAIPAKLKAHSEGKLNGKTTSKTEENRRLVEGRLKRITQGLGRIKAVLKYENPFEVPETHSFLGAKRRSAQIRGVLVICATK